MTSHELAESLREIANQLEQRAPFAVTKACIPIYYPDKESFLAAVKGIGGGSKKTDNYFFTVTREIGKVAIELSVWRETVCTLVTPAQPAVYECEPLLSQSEEQEAGVL